MEHKATKQNIKIPILKRSICYNIIVVAFHTGIITISNACMGAIEKMQSNQTSMDNRFHGNQWPIFKI
jgi:hypothetical protein